MSFGGKEGHTNVQISGTSNLRLCGRKAEGEGRALSILRPVRRPAKKELKGKELGIDPISRSNSIKFHCKKFTNDLTNNK